MANLSKEIGVLSKLSAGAGSVKAASGFKITPSKEIKAITGGDLSGVKTIIDKTITAIERSTGVKIYDEISGVNVSLAKAYQPREIAKISLGFYLNDDDKQTKEVGDKLISKKDAFKKEFGTLKSTLSYLSPEHSIVAEVSTDYLLGADVIWQSK